MYNFISFQQQRNYFKLIFYFILNRNCENENRHQTYKAAKLIGRQEGSEVWILDENTQIDGKGKIVPEEDQEFVWIDDLFDDKVKTQEVIYPFKTDIINDVLRALKETLHTNFMASLVAVGKFDKWIVISSVL